MPQVHKKLHTIIICSYHFYLNNNLIKLLLNCVLKLYKCLFQLWNNGIFNYVIIEFNERLEIMSASIITLINIDES